MTTAGTRPGENEDLLVGVLRLLALLCIRRRRRGLWLIWVDQAQIDVLLSRAMVGSHVPFRVLHAPGKLDERGPRWVVKPNGEWLDRCVLPACFLRQLDLSHGIFLFVIIGTVSKDILETVDNALDLVICRLVLYPPERLVGAQVGDGVADKTLDSSELSAGRRYCEVELGYFYGACCRLDHLSIEVIARQDTDGVNHALGYAVVSVRGSESK